MAACSDGWLPPFAYYRDVYGGSLGVKDYAEALPGALRQFRHVVGALDMRRVRGNERDYCRRAICAAADCIAEWGEGQTGGFELGKFSVTHYDNRGTTGAEQATEAILKELSGSGLAFTGAGR